MLLSLSLHLSLSLSDVHRNFVIQEEANQVARTERIAIYASNIANIVIFVAKVYASVESRSLAVIASTLDSLLDLLSGFILWYTSYAMSKPNQYRYPIGKNRMQPVVSPFPCLKIINKNLGLVF